MSASDGSSVKSPGKPPLTPVPRRRVGAEVAASLEAAAAKTGQRPKPKPKKPAPGLLPYFLLGGAALCSLLLPLYVLFVDGVPETVKHAFEPPKAGAGLPSRATHAKPQPGVHFTPGTLHGEGRALGSPSTADYVVEFTDFLCDHCQAAHRTLVEPLVAQFVARGGLRLESHPVAFLGGDSARAAAAALCAQEQHKYWEVRELLFQVAVAPHVPLPAGAAEATAAAGAPENGTSPPAPGVFTASLLKRLADVAGLDRPSFVECFESRRHAPEVARLSAVARRLGVLGTPTFLVNGVIVEGAVALEDITSRLRVRFEP